MQIQKVELAFSLEEYEKLLHATRTYLWFYRLAEWLGTDNKRHVVVASFRLIQLQEDVSAFVVGHVPYG